MDYCNKEIVRNALSRESDTVPEAGMKIETKLCQKILTEGLWAEHYGKDTDRGDYCLGLLICLIKYVQTLFQASV